MGDLHWVVGFGFGFFGVVSVFCLLCWVWFFGLFFCCCWWVFSFYNFRKTTSDCFGKLKCNSCFLMGFSTLHSPRYPTNCPHKRFLTSPCSTLPTAALQIVQWRITMSCLGTKSNHSYISTRLKSISLNACLNINYMVIADFFPIKAHKAEYVIQWWYFDFSVCIFLRETLCPKQFSYF